jgi:predicted DNA-binding protein
MLEKTLIQLDKEKKRRLMSKAQKKGISMSAAIREAVDVYVEDVGHSPKQALMALAENAVSRKDYRPDINSENFRLKIFTERFE